MPHLVACFAADGDTLDATGNTSASLEAGATFVTPGRLGSGAFSFDGQSAYVNVGGAGALPIASAITFEAYINPQPSLGGMVGTVFAWRDPFWSEGLMVSVTEDGRLMLNVRTSNMNLYGSAFETDPGAVSMGRWQHIVVSADSAAPVGRQVAMFIDGVYVPATYFGANSNGPVLAGDIVRAGQMFIGQRQGNDTSEGVWGGGHFNGAIDDVQLFDVAAGPVPPPSVDNLVRGGYVSGGPLTITGHTVANGHVICHHRNGGDIWETDAGADGTWSMTINLSGDGEDDLYFEDTSGGVGDGTVVHNYAGGPGGIPVVVDSSGTAPDFQITGDGGVGGWYLNDVSGGINAIDTRLADGTGSYQIFWSASGDDTVDWTEVDGGPCGCLPDGTIRFHRLGQRTLSYYVVDQNGHRGPVRQRIIRNKAPLAISGVSATPGVFSTASGVIRAGSGGLTLISYTLSEPGSINVRISGDSGQLIRTLVGGVSRNGGVWTGDAWDGRDDRGVLVANCGCHISVDGVDATGNTAIGGTGSLLIDSTPPMIAISGVTDGGTATPGVAPTIDIQEVGSGLDASRTAISLDGQPFASGTAIAELGPHVLVVSAQDLAGNPARTVVGFDVRDPLGGMDAGGGAGPGATPNVADTPELDSLVLFGSGFAGVAGYALTRRRARRQR